MTTFCLVNGSTQDPGCWDLLVPELEERGFKVVTPSLPRDTPEASATEYARVVAESIPEHATDVLLVGHSASGMFIPLVPSVRPIRSLVYLAALVPNPGQSIRDQLAEDPGMMNPRWIEEYRKGRDPSTDDDMAIEFLFHDCNADAVRLGLATRARMYADAAMSEVFPLEVLPDVPATYIVCSEDRTIAPDWSRRIARERLGVEPIEIPGGHSPYLSRPGVLADVLAGLTE
jgi:pimeloyl-ACP methyl ester carboxylesterase